VTVRTATALAVAVVVALVTVGCAAGSAPTQPSGHKPSRATPAPTRTVIAGARVYPAGATAVIHAQAGVGLRLRASAPRVSRTSLSSSYGYAPSRGYYVTFRLVAANTGRRPISLTPRDFVVRIPGRGQVTSYDGNAPYSGAGAQLDATVLDAGQRVAAPLTFDVSRPHGRLAFAPDGSAAAIWTF
jgi:hypothetical protein